jgi:Glycosyl transferase family 2
MIRRALRGPIDWRLRALTDRLDALAERAQDIQQRFDGIQAQASQLDSALRELTTAMPQLLEGTAATRAAVEHRLEPMLTAIVSEEAENRRRLNALRSREDYEEPFTDADPLVSVTVPTRGREALLTRALPSLLAQTHANLAVIVVGDAVTPELERELTALEDPRVSFANLSQRIQAHEDPRRHWLVGSTMARNEATRRARGGWLLHFDDDDHLRPEAIASLLRLAREQRAEVAYGGFQEHLPDGESTTGLGFPPRSGRFSWGGALVHGGLRFFERELVAADLELPGDLYMLERMLRAGVRFALLEQVVLDYYPSTLWEAPDMAPDGPPGPAARSPTWPVQSATARAGRAQPRPCGATSSARRRGSVGGP